MSPIRNQMIGEEAKGKSINIVSMGAGSVIHDDCRYCASKGGIVNLTAPPGSDPTPLGIGLSAIGPGVFDTPTAHDVSMQREDFSRNRIAKTPGGTIVKPGKISSSSPSLACGESGFIAGQAFIADRGCVEIRVDGKDGPFLAEMDVAQGVDWSAVRAPVSGSSTGVHNLLVLLREGTKVEIDWIRFE